MYKLYLTLESPSGDIKTEKLLGANTLDGVNLLFLSEHLEEMTGILKKAEVDLEAKRLTHERD